MSSRELLQALTIAESSKDTIEKISKGEEDLNK